jgi:hypothetical protein
LTVRPEDLVSSKEEPAAPTEMLNRQVMEGHKNEKGNLNQHGFCLASLRP